VDAAKAEHAEMVLEARSKKPTRRASGGSTSSRRPSSKYDLSNVAIMLETAMLPDMRKYMKKDEERGER